MKKIVVVLLFLMAIQFAAAKECNVSISIESNKEIFDNNDKIEFFTRLNNAEFDYIIEYWIEDSSGKIVKQKRNTTNQNKKTFTPKNLAEDIVLKAKIVDLGCADVNTNDNLAEKRIYFGEKSENLTAKIVTVSFAVDKNKQKLKDFASAINITTEKSKKTNSENKLIKAAPYFLIALTTILSIVLIWKR